MAHLRNFTSKLLGEGVVRIATFLFVFLAGRVLGAEQFGVYSTAFSFASLFLIVADAGMLPIVSREVARDPDHRAEFVGTVNLLKLLLAVTALLATHFIGYASAFARSHHLLVDCLAIVVITYSLSDYFGALLNGKEEMGWEAILRGSSRMLITMSGLGALYVTKSLTATALAMALGSLVALVGGAGIIKRRFGTVRPRWDPDRAKQLLMSSLPLLGFIVAWIFYDNQDILLLNYFRIPAQDIGLFWSATKVVDVMKVLPIILIGVFFPSLSRFAATRESFLHTARVLYGYSLLAAPIAAAMVFWMAPLIETTLYGEEFVAAAIYLRFLLPAFVFMFLNIVGMNILIAKGLERSILPGTIVAWLTNLVLSVVLIPRVGTAGACYAVLLSETLFFIVQGRLILDAVPGLFNPFRRTYG